jgi:hypothetical protein
VGLQAHGKGFLPNNAGASAPELKHLQSEFPGLKPFLFLIADAAA